MEVILETLKKLWNQWQLRGSVLGSLLLQIVLICTGNLRKRNSSSVVTFVLWMAYRSADWVATFALGIISNILSHPLSDKNHDPDILSFWTPFLLLHLGGPDTITAFSLEDNQLWLRHALSLLLQLIAVLYIFVRSMKGSRLVFPTFCVFIAGTLKYGERTWALRCASMDGLRGSMINDADPGPNYVAIMDDFSSKLHAGIPAKLYALKESDVDVAPSSSCPATGAENENIDELVDHLQILDTAYRSFQTFKRLFVDLILSFKERDASKSIFSRIRVLEAYKVIEIELNFVYDALYTKALVVHTTLGRIIHVINFLAILTACFYFFSVDKNGFRRKDIFITYLLLVGALALEIVSMGLLIVSDWTLVMLRNSKYHPYLKWAEWFVLKTLTKFRPADKRRWSHCLGQYSLLSFCLQDQQTIFVKLLRTLNAKELYDRYKFTEYVKVLQELEVIIFNDLKNKSQNQEDAETYKNYTTCRGERSLQQDEDCSQLGWSIDVEFDESLLLWHIATAICYHLLRNTDNPAIAQYREASKLISQYMLYLLIVCPFTLSSTAGLGLIRYGDTCAELTKFLKEEGLIGDGSGSRNMSFLCKPKGIVPETTQNACETLLFVHTDIPPKMVKGDRSKSVLWNAVELAKQLKDLEEEKMWKTTCNVWIEMLCFASRHCRGNYHAQLLSAGGELLTLVWFLEAHLGMGEYFQIKSGHVTTTVVLES